MHKLIALLAVTALPAAAADNLFVNGSFEAPLVGYHIVPGGSTAITGWTTALSGVEHYSAGASAADGTMVVDLANYTYSNGAIEQTITTVAGQSYEVSFFAGNTRSSGRDGTGIVKVTIDGGSTLQFDTAVATGAAYAWEQRRFSFTAADAATTIRFWNDQNSFTHFALIDGVGAVAAVPEPASAALWLAGLVATAAFRLRRG